MRFRRAPLAGPGALFLVASGLALTLAGCGNGRGHSAPSNSAMLIPLSSDIRGTNPGVNRDANTDTIMLHVVEGLVGFREDGIPDLLLAKSLSVSPDGLRYIFQLRDDILFHNGRPLTSAEVVWSWKRYLDPATNWTCLSKFDGTDDTKIVDVRALNRSSVQFTLNRRSPLFLTEMADFSCGGGAILHPDSIGPKGDWREPISTGPYRITRWDRGSLIEMKAFDRYRPVASNAGGNIGGKIPYEKTLQWIVIRDASSRLAALDKGQVAVMTEVPAAELVRAKRIKGVHIKSAPMLGSYGILIQDHHRLLADPRIRAALSFAIDRSTLAKLVNEGTVGGNASMVPTSSPYASPVPNLYNPERARQLLKQAGYKGEPIRLTTNRSYPAMYNQALVVQAMARQVGLNIEIEVLEWATQLSNWRAGNFELMSFGFSAKPDPSLSFEMIIGDRKNSPSKIWDDPQALALLKQSASVEDVEARRAIFRNLDALMLRDNPYIALFSPSDNNAVRDTVTGFRSWQFGRARFWGVRRTQEGKP